MEWKDFYKEQEAKGNVIAESVSACNMVNREEFLKDRGKFEIYMIKKRKDDMINMRIKRLENRSHTHWWK